MDADAWKRDAARRALEEVRDGMRVGLGTGSTARHFTQLLGERVAQGLRVICVPTSEATRIDADAAKIPLTTLDELDSLDLTVDGADEIDGRLDAIKGGGAALLREKIVAAASARMIVIADESKLVDHLGRFPLPIEIVPFGIAATMRALTNACAGQGTLTLRRKPDGHVLVTDGGHWIVDASLNSIADPPALAARLAAIPGVVEHGLFVGLVTTAIFAGPSGLRVIERPLSRP